MNPILASLLDEPFSTFKFAFNWICEFALFALSVNLGVRKKKATFWLFAVGFGLWVIHPVVLWFGSPHFAHEVESLQNFVGAISLLYPVGLALFLIGFVRIFFGKDSISMVIK